MLFPAPVTEKVTVLPEAAKFDVPFALLAPVVIVTVEPVAEPVFPLIVAIAPGDDIVIDPAPLVIRIPEPAIIVAKTGVEPIGICPFVAAPRLEDFAWL